MSVDVFKAQKDIDIGDITYGVYGLIRYAGANSSPRNIEVTELSSPRFDNRIQLLTLDISPPYQHELDFIFWLGSTRILRNHTVQMKAHVFREYIPAGSTDGLTVIDQLMTVEHTLGNMRGTLKPFEFPFDPFEGMDSYPETMLLYSELEAWLYLHTEVDSFDPENPPKEADDYARYNGFNPARINFLGGAQESSVSELDESQDEPALGVVD